LKPSDILDFSANINPLGLPHWFGECINMHLIDIKHYPDRDARALVQAIAESSGVPGERVVVGNGTTELIYALPRATESPLAVIPSPAYSDYAAACRLAGVEVEQPLMREEEGFEADLEALGHWLEKAPTNTLVFLGQPNNPTGLLNERGKLLDLVQKYPHVFFCIDEAFADFIEEYQSLLEASFSNLIVFRSFTKFYAIPGLRLGWLAAIESVAQKIRALLPTWSVNTLAQAVGERACYDKEYGNNTRAYVRAAREELRSSLDEISGLTVYPGRANYLFARIDHPTLRAGDLSAFLLHHAIAIRECESYVGLDDRFFRIAVRKHEENRLLASRMKEFFS
jgi:L-threonine-O-3-phosphate decarboxylase